MGKSHLTRLSGFVFGAILLILLLTACGGRGHRSLPTSASLQPQPQPQPQVEQSVEEVLAELDAMTAPPEVDASTFAQLKEALRAELLSRFNDKVVSGPPTGPENEITDFAFEDNGDGTYTFSWSYVNVGDYNQDSVVNISDITPLAVHFNETANPDNEWIDGNSDTVINISDITPLAAHFLDDVGWYLIEGAETVDGTYEEVGTVDFSEGTEGSRVRFGSIFPVGAYKVFQVIAYSAAGLPGAGSRRTTFGPSAQADADEDGRDVQFYGVGSDPHGGNVAFLWDFESDGTFDTRGAGIGLNPNTDSGEQSPLHTYPADGTYTATLRVYDTSGNYSEAKVTVEAYDSTPASAAPSVSALVLDLTGEAPFHVRFRSFSNDPDGGTILLYTWDFGDGSPIQTNATVDHTYMNPGTFTVRLTIEDEEAQLSYAQLVIKVCPSGSIPDLHPSAVNAPFVNPGSTIVGFVGQAADMDGGPENYVWDFGDNSLPDTTQDPNHAYTASPPDGVYYATVHVRDDESNHSSAGSTFIIGSPTGELPSAFVLPYITSGTQNMLVQFFGNGQFLDGRTVEYSWDFDGDGTYGDYSITDGDPIVAYTAVGNYQVGLRVMDAGDHNKYSSASATITVHPCLMPMPPPAPPGEIPTVPIPTPPPLGNPINARCHPCPLSIAHGPDGGTLWLIYSDSGGMDPLAAGYPSLSQIQQFGPNPIAPWLWGPQGEIGNTGNGNAGADIVVPIPPGMAPPPPPGANVKPGESWNAYTISGPKDGPPRVVRQDIKFHLKRADGSAFASQTCTVYIYHSVGEIQEPLSDEYVSGDVSVIAEVDPTGTDDWIGFIDLDPGDQINVYLEVDGTVVDPLPREGDTNMWSGMWDSTTVTNGEHTLRALYYDTRDPQPGEPEDHGSFWETLAVTVNVDNGPPMQTDHVTIEMVPSGSTNVGGASDILVTTEDSGNSAVYDDFLDVFVEISPKRSETMSQLPKDAALQPRTHERIIPLTPDGSGHYVTIFSWEVSGTYALSVIVVDTRIGPNGDKVAGLTAAVDYDILPGDVANVQLYGGNSAYGPAYFWAEDSWGDVHPSPDPLDFGAWTDTPALTASSPQMVPGSNSMLETRISANAYAVGMLTIEHPLSGTIQQQFVGYPPWDIECHLPGRGLEDMALREKGIPSGELFEADFELRVPDGGEEWNAFETQLLYDVSPHFGLLSVTPKQPYDNFTVTGPTLEGDHYRLVVSGNLLPGQSMGGEVVAYSLECMASTEEVAVETSVVVDPDNMPQLWDASGIYIPYDEAMFSELFCSFPFEIKPTKTLNMHIYRVEGAATDAQINDDVQAAEDMFNLNAFLCTLGFYVDFVPTIDTIPTADWNEIDEDGDGLDRYDANNDGDYLDEGDNDDLQNAKDKGYFDSTPDPPTENVYYVPGIRGGAMGTTYWTNSQVAVDNSLDSDNLTLAHEKVHELDLRKDGDFDVLDGADMNDTKDGIQRDPTAETQGAYEADNIMNYGDTGPLLSATQGAELDP